MSIPFSAANFFARGLTNTLPFGPAGVAGRVTDGVGATGWDAGGTGATFLKSYKLLIHHCKDWSERSKVHILLSQSYGN